MSAWVSTQIKHMARGVLTRSSKKQREGNEIHRTLKATERIGLQFNSKKSSASVKDEGKEGALECDSYSTIHHLYLLREGYEEEKGG